MPSDRLWGPRKYLRTRRSQRPPDPIQRQQTSTSTSATQEARSWVKSKISPLFSSWSEPQQRYNADESYFPLPKITFLIDKPRDLLCQICREATCEIKPDSDSFGDSTFSIFPCGHAAGSQCLRSWLRTHDTCPFCRLSLRYPGCGHRIPARPMTKESLHLLPRTLPDGGCIPSECARCQKEALVIDANKTFEVAVHEFCEARRRFNRSGGVKDEETMLAKREVFENVLREEVYLRHLSTWLTSW